MNIGSFVMQASAVSQAANWTSGASQRYEAVSPSSSEAPADYTMFPTGIDYFLQPGAAQQQMTNPPSTSQTHRGVGDYNQGALQQQGQRSQQQQSQSQPGSSAFLNTGLQAQLNAANAFPTVQQYFQNAVANPLPLFTAAATPSEPFMFP
ncbi:hypothetical protein RvY_18942-2 [Ramazzottius varieornatus]|uniref:Uncharacterized protein n=1 Tax=Ramazzottius varieornatus TaxID=947166 RepID=A0A1D1WBC2_RAMVA|nr:hypothetical protein RvY_18942-2 [Ramazzottius varieornatus]